MDADQILIAKSCLRAAEAGTESFPRILGRLGQAGFEGYAVDYRQGTQTFFLPSGEAVTHAMRPASVPVAAQFDAAELARLVAWAQSGDASYSYGAFSDRARLAGCAGYLVSLPGRRVLYFGRTAETHVEHFPN